jgi:type IV pilus assembly protein PilC
MKKRMYKYRAVDAYGEPLDGTMEETSADRVTKVLSERGIQVSSVEPFGGDEPTRKSGQGLTWDDIALFNEQLLAITKSKLPLAPSVRAMSRDLKKGSLKTVLKELHEDLELGKSLEEAFQNRVDRFPAMYVRMVQAGEKSGNLSGVLEIMSAHSTRMVDLKNNLRTILAYPTMVIGAGAIVISFLLVKVVPVFGEIFGDFGAALPAPTQLLIDLSYILTEYGQGLIIALMSILLVGAAMRFFVIPFPAGRLFLDRLLLHTPFLGPVFRTASLARFSRSLGLMLKSRIPILECLDLAASASGNAVLQKHANAAAIQVSKGEKLADSLSDTGYFPHGFCWFIANGEAYGNLAEVLLDVSHSYEKDVTQSDQGLMNLLSPAIVVVLGFFVAYIVIALYMPIFSLGDAISG